jgi:hypothetical protein
MITNLIGYQYKTDQFVLSISKKMIPLVRKHNLYSLTNNIMYLKVTIIVIFKINIIIL